jgi:hypothetical protein
MIGADLVGVASPYFSAAATPVLSDTGRLADTPARTTGHRRRATRRAKLWSACSAIR